MTTSLTAAARTQRVPQPSAHPLGQGLQLAPPSGQTPSAGSRHVGRHLHVGNRVAFSYGHTTPARPCSYITSIKSLIFWGAVKRSNSSRRATITRGLAMVWLRCEVRQGDDGHDQAQTPKPPPVLLGEPPVALQQPGAVGQGLLPSSGHGRQSHAEGRPHPCPHAGSAGWRGPVAFPRGCRGWCLSRRCLAKDPPSLKGRGRVFSGKTAPSLTDGKPCRRYQ